MAVSALANLACRKHVTIDGPVDTLSHKLAYLVDLVVTAALITVAILGMRGVIPMQSIIAYSLLGAGATYGALTVLRGLEKAKESGINCKRPSGYEAIPEYR